MTRPRDTAHQGGARPKRSGLPSNNDNRIPTAVSACGRACTAHYPHRTSSSFAPLGHRASGRGAADHAAADYPSPSRFTPSPCPRPVSLNAPCRAAWQRLRCGRCIPGAVQASPAQPTVNACLRSVLHGCRLVASRERAIHAVACDCDVAAFRCWSRSEPPTNPPTTACPRRCCAPPPPRMLRTPSCRAGTICHPLPVHRQCILTSVIVPCLMSQPFTFPQRLLHRRTLSLTPRPLSTTLKFDRRAHCCAQLFERNSGNWRRRGKRG